MSAKNNLSINQCINNTFSFIKQIDQSTEHAARLISQKQISVKNSGIAMMTLVTIRSLLSELIEQKAHVVESCQKDDFKDLIFTIELSRLVLDQLFHAINHNFSKPLNITKNDLDRIREVKESSNNTTQQITKSYNALKNKMSKLQSATNNIGLTWYNKVARKLDRYVVSPWQRNHMTNIVLGLTGLTLGTIYLIANYGEFLENAPFLPAKAQGDDGYVARLRRWWGHPILTNSDGVAIHPTDKVIVGNEDDNVRVPRQLTAEELNNAPYTWRSHLTGAAKTLMRGVDPVGGIATGIGMAHMTGLLNKVRQPIRQEMQILWNHLRGGAYLKKPVSGVWNFTPTHKLEKVIGLEQVKSEFEVLLEFIKNPEASIQRGLIPSKAYLLTGPPGVGKTFILEGLCGEIDEISQITESQSFKFFKIDAPLIRSFHDGIKGILSIAKAAAPCVVFIDELDLLGLQRAGNNELLAQFLTSMGNTLDNDPTKLVILVAATNKPQMLDKALLRAGRFKEIRVDYPPYLARKKFLDKELLSYGLNPTHFNTESLAQETAEKTIEDIRASIRRAIIHSWIHDTSVTQKMLEVGLNKEVHHIVLDNTRVLPEAEKEMLTSYYAGQALAFELLDTSKTLVKVTTKAVTPELREKTIWQDYTEKKEEQQATIVYGKTFLKPKHIDSINIATTQELRNECKAYLAGAAAQKVLQDTTSLQMNNSDVDAAFVCAKKIAYEGINPQSLTDKTRKTYEHHAHTIFLACKKEVQELMENNRDSLEKLKVALKEKELLNRSEIIQII